MASYGGIAAFAIIMLMLIPFLSTTWINYRDVLINFEKNSLFLRKRLLDIKAYSLDINESTIAWKNKFILSFWVLNSGTRSISVKEFPYMDLIIVYYTSSGEMMVLWIPYKPSGTPGTDIFWRIEDIRVYGDGEEIINPIYPPPSGLGVEPESGMWDPGEEVLITAYLTPALAANITAPIFILLALRVGIYDEISWGD